MWGAGFTRPRAQRSRCRRWRACARVPTDNESGSGGRTGSPYTDPRWLLGGEEGPRATRHAVSSVATRTQLAMPWS